MLKKPERVMNIAFVFSFLFSSPDLISGVIRVKRLGTVDDDDVPDSFAAVGKPSEEVEDNMFVV